MSRPIVLIWGESQNDTHALEHLVRGMLPQDKLPVDVKKLRNPTILSRSAQPRKRAEVAKFVAAQERVERKHRAQVVVVAHRDCDAVEPSHVENSAELEAELRAAGVTKPVAATPAWCIENWWMLFPDELSNVRGCWRRLNLGGRDVGQIQDGKRALTEALRPQQAKHSCPDYRESDSISIAQRISAAGAVRHPRKLRSASLTRFRDRLVEMFD